MSNAKYFPLDIKSAQSYGLEKWYQEFSWPVSYENHIKLETEIKQALNELIEENSDNELSDLLLITYKIFFLYSNFLCSVWVLDELHKKNLEPQTGDTLISKGIVENGVPLCSGLALPFIQQKKSLMSLKTKAKRIKESLQLYGLTSSFWKSLSHNAPYVTNNHALNNLGTEYVTSKLGGHVTIKDAQWWYPRNYDPTITPSQKKAIRELVKKIVERIEKTANRRDLNLTKLQLTYLSDITFDFFHGVMVRFNALEDRISKMKPVNLLVSINGDYFSRMLSVLVRKYGGSVTGFQHGEPMIICWDRYSWLELPLVDRFVTYTEHSAGILETLLETYPPLKSNPVKILGAETKHYYNICRKELNKPFPKEIKRVMVIAKGYASSEYHVGHGISFPELMQLDCDLRIIKALKNAGCEVMYKKHPDGKFYKKEMDFLESGVEVICDRFEDVMDYADAYLFYHTITTTIGTALCTNKPVIYIDGGWENWIPEVRELFEKRCCIVSANFDDHNHLVINQEELLNALDRKPAEPNTEFLEKYMFPKGITL